MISAVIHAGELVTVNSVGPKTGNALQDLGVIRDGAVAFDEYRILEVGITPTIQKKYSHARVIDAAGKVVMPGFVDPHTHLVFMGSRHEEYESKISGKTYSELHKTGGIRYTVDRTRKASKEELVEQSLKDLDLMLAHGTTTVEAKTGYGLDEKNELKILEVIQELRSRHVVDIIPTFLGAHTLPVEYRDNRKGYVDLVKNLIPKFARLAEFCDVWCDPLGFTVEETREVFDVARKNGMKLKIHAEQTDWCAGAELAAQYRAVSADHLDFISDEGIRLMKESGTVAVLLPGVTYHLMEFGKNIPVAKMIESGMVVALATDYNPGSSRTLSMQTIIQHAARLYRMDYAQAICAATLNAAYAVDRGKEIGSIQAGKRADLVIFDAPSHGILINHFGINHVDTVIKNSKVVVENGRVTSSLRNA